MPEASGRAPLSPGSPPAPGAELAPIREITIRGVVLGLALALLLGAANAYLGLYAGMTVSASIPAAVISMAVLRALGGATILENNVVQTIASAGEAMAAGAIFTFPALVILGYPQALSYWDVTLLSAVGGALGSLLVVFLRRTYIVEERLPFPEGVACAHVLRVGAQGEAKVAPLVWGGALAATLKAAQDLAGLVPGIISGARWVGGAALAGGLNVSAALLGVGYLIGVRIASLVFLGGALAWLVAIPVLSVAQPEWRTLGAAEAAARIWGGQARFLGLGAMLVGGLATLWRLRGPIARALSESRRRPHLARGTGVAREDLDLSPRAVLSAIGLCIPALFALYLHVTGNWWLSAALALALTAIGFMATAIAGYLTGIVGASNNPVSGVTIIVLLTVAMLLRLFGVAGEIGPRVAIMVGAVVCTAAAMAGDSLHDLATGYHVGATPRALEMSLLTGAIASSFVVAPILRLLISGYGIAGTATAKAGALAAPQAFLMAKVTQGVFSGGLPWGMISAGAGLALALAAADHFLERRGSRWRTPVMPVAIGLYLPFGLGAAILLGALARQAAGGRAPADDGGGGGVLFAAGLVAGEALMGVVNGALVTASVRLPLL